MIEIKRRPRNAATGGAQRLTESVKPNADAGIALAFYKQHGVKTYMPLEAVAEDFETLLDQADGNPDMFDLCCRVAVKLTAEYAEDYADRVNRRHEYSAGETLIILKAIRAGEVELTLPEGDKVRLSKSGRKYNYVPVCTTTGESISELLDRYQGGAAHQRGDGTMIAGAGQRFFMLN